jgi:hypothetical protein
MSTTLDVYIMSDQPEQCRLCGARTEIEHEDVEDGLITQIHHCHNCNYTYQLESDDEEEA